MLSVVKMTYEGLKDTVDRAWGEFLARLDSETGCGFFQLQEALDRKDVFNGAFDAVMSVVKLENENE